MKGFLSISDLTFRIVNAQMEQYIQDKKRANKESSKSRDILDLALTDPEYGATASMSELVDQMKTFFFAGHDTTASTISWSYYFLSHHPSSLIRLRNELDDIFGPNTSPAQVAKQLMADPKLHNKLDFTLAVIKESLRLEPPAAAVREAYPNYTFKTSSGATFSPPVDAMIYLSGWMLHRNNNVWGEDAEEFKPERLMPGNSIPWGYLPFAKRPRDCIGSSLAYLEVPPLFHDLPVL
jgi:cytochrome P450